MFKSVLKLFAIILSFIALSSLSAEEITYATNITGNDLMSFCSGKSDAQVMLCKMYIQGSIDQLFLMTELENGHEGMRCIWEVNTGVTHEQMQKVVIKYLNDHPEDLNLSAPSLITQPIFTKFIVKHGDEIKQCVLNYRKQASNSTHGSSNTVELPKA